MLPYFLLMALVAAPALVSGRWRKNEGRPPHLWFQTVLLVLAIGLRAEVGGDWFVYLRTFRFCASTDIWSAMTLSVSDPAYGLVNWAVGHLGLGVWGVNLICALIFALGLRSFCRMQSNPELAVLVAVPYMCIVVAMGYTRQSIALGLIMAATVAYQHNKIARFAILLVLATAFHKSAIIVTPLFAFASAKTRWTVFLAVMLTAVVGYYVFLASAVDKLIGNYVSTGAGSGGAGVRAAMGVVAAVTLLAYRNKLPFREGERSLWYAFAFAALATAALLGISPSSTAVDRIALYLLPLQIVAFSRLPDIRWQQGVRSTGLVAIVVGYSLLVLIVWLEFGNASWTWIPYRNYLWLPDSFVPSYHRE